MNPKKNLINPTVNTFESSCAYLRKTLISTAQKEESIARNIPLTLLVIEVIYKKGNEQTSPLYFF